MTASISYKGNTLATADNNTKTLLTSGKYLEDDITVTDVTSSPTLITKSITANGTYNASSDSADGYSSVTVNVPSNWTLLATETFNVNTTDTSASSVGDIQLSVNLTSEDIIWIHIRDTNGKRTGYFYGSDSFAVMYTLKNNSINYVSSFARLLYMVNSDGLYATSHGQAYAIYPYRIYDCSTSSPYVRINRRYSSSYGTINGSFKCDVYKLTHPTGMTIFD